MTSGFALAFTAGLVATVNPCGFAMLPAYLSYFMGLQDQRSEVGRADAVRQGFVVGGVVSAGFLLVFTAVGVPIAFGLRSIIDFIPWAAIVIGVGVAVLGLVLLGGHELTVGLPTLDTGGHSRGYRSVFLFGISYAVASLSCTLPVFLVVVAGALPRMNVVSGVLTFVVYGLGMSLTLLAVTLLLAFSKSAVLGWLRRSARHVNRVAGGVLVLAGAYIVWFWVTNLRNPTATSAPVVFVEAWSSRATELIGSRPWTSAAVFASVVALALVALVAARRNAREDASGAEQTRDDAERTPEAEHRMV